MKSKPWKAYVFWILFAEAVGALSGWLSRDGFEIYSKAVRQPPFSPPALLFPIVWTILYALMGIGAARVRLTLPTPERNKGINLFLIQLAVNFLWTPVFFNAQAYGLAFLWLLLLWGLVLAMILQFRRVDPLAAKMQVPYLIWLTFAAYLNLGVWFLNR